LFPCGLGPRWSNRATPRINGEHRRRLRGVDAIEGRGVLSSYAKGFKFDFEGPCWVRVRVGNVNSKTCRQNRRLERDDTGANIPHDQRLGQRLLRNNIDSVSTEETSPPRNGSSRLRIRLSFWKDDAKREEQKQRGRGVGMECATVALPIAAIERTTFAPDRGPLQLDVGGK
jgi:hypothetical protein